MSPSPMNAVLLCVANLGLAAALPLGLVESTKPGTDGTEDKTHETERMDLMGKPLQFQASTASGGNSKLWKEMSKLSEEPTVLTRNSKLGKEIGNKLDYRQPQDSTVSGGNSKLYKLLLSAVQTLQEDQAMAGSLCGSELGTAERRRRGCDRFGGPNSGPRFQESTASSRNAERGKEIGNRFDYKQPQDATVSGGNLKLGKAMASYNTFNYNE